jgi:hypothetical protein
MSSTLVVAAVENLTGAPGGPRSMSSTLVVAAAGPTASTPQGLGIDVFNFGGGR